MRISIHALLAESDCQPFHTVYHFTISIHALLAESDKTILIFTSRLLLFLSTLSLRRATVPAGATAEFEIISIHALLAESDFGITAPHRHTAISIHALLAESDSQPAANAVQDCNFYPRSPCGERPPTRVPALALPEFLSTLSLRRATPVLSVNVRA